MDIIYHLLVTQIHACHPVNGFDVILHSLYQIFPFGLDGLLVGNFPAIGSGFLKFKKYC